MHTPPRTPQHDDVVVQLVLSSRALDHLKRGQRGHFVELLLVEQPDGPFALRIMGTRASLPPAALDVTEEVAP